MAATKELIKRIRLTASAASITFYNIPQDFDGLELVYSLRSDRADGYADYLAFAFNGSTASISMRTLRGTGSSVGSETTATAGAVYDGNTATANTFGNGTAYFPNYTSSNYKSISLDSVSENNATDSQQRIAAGLWSNTAAITSITLDQDSGANFLQYSSAALYGWKKGTDGITSVS